MILSNVNSCWCK